MSEQDGESKAQCAQSYRNFPFEEQGFCRLPLSTPQVFGAQGSKPGDEWHEVTHAPNPKHLTLEN